MNQNSDTVYSRAARSNLTASAVEFVPQSFSYYNCHPASSLYNSSHNDYHCENSRELSSYDRSYECRDFGGHRRNQSFSRRDYYEDGNRPNSYFDQRHKKHTSPNSKVNRQQNQARFMNQQFSIEPNEYSRWKTSNGNRSKKIHGSDNRPYADNFEYHNQAENNFMEHMHEQKGGSGFNGTNVEHQISGQYNNYDKNSRQKNSRRNFDYEDGNCAHFSNRSKLNLTQSRSKGENEKSLRKIADSSKSIPNTADSICQRDRLIEQLNKGVHECLICCEVIRQREPTWNCSNCYYVLHMWCVIKWARSSMAESNCWRCPACQFEFSQKPEKYMCFCGKSKLQTEWNRNDTAHSCGEVCGRKRDNPTPWFICEHRCTLLCHPGPCPPCSFQVTRECGCGRTQRSVQCSAKTEILCGAICDRLLNCGIHHCTKTCHVGDCGACIAKVTVECFCGKKTKEIVCGGDQDEKFPCQAKCKKLLSCGNHICESLCHPGECGLCVRDPVVLNTCMCGKTQMTENTRTSCLDDVFLCGQVCGKVLKCGPPNKKHTCQHECHDGDCNFCTKKTVIKCRCGALKKDIPCSQLNSKESLFKCDKKCAKKRSCGKHKCNQTCCMDEEHNCFQRCNRSLSCNKHKCELLCHRGECGRCLLSSFEELYCHCGHSVIYPPVPCGTKPPKCDQPCKRKHDCDHPPLHMCHSDRECPPCSVFTDKFCYGGHELRKTIPCYQKEFSCGLPCGALLPCSFHKCQQPCHVGECLALTKTCIQPCTKPRDLCGHPCAASCHTGICPETRCREIVTVTCACGNVVAKHPCYDHTDDYRRIISITLAAKVSELQFNNSVNIGDTNDKITAQIINLRTLECSDECKLIMRNRRLALALQIQNPDLSSKLTPKFSDFMKSWAKKDAPLCKHIHDNLTALVKLAKESKQKSRSYSFEVMNKDKRQLVHEYCAYFGCESEAYDAEPKRNVVAIATKGRCWLPACSLLEVVQREMGQRKVPVPVINKRVNSKEDNVQSNTTRIILPILPSAHSSHTGINYFGE